MDSKVITLRPYEAADYLEIEGWWKFHQWTPVLIDALPENGMIASIGGRNVAACWIYKTDSKMCWVDWIISNPDSTVFERSQCIDKLLDAMTGFAKQLGFKVIFCSLMHHGLIKKLQRHGFVIGDEGMTLLVKSLKED